MVAAVLCLVRAAAFAAPPSGGKHCLWRIANAPASFYLLGSVHALSASDYERTPAIEDAIKQSAQIYFEFDPKEEQSFTKKLQEAAKYPQGEQIRGKVSPKTYNYLMKITTHGWGDWQHLRPWAIAMRLNYPAMAGISGRYGIDTHVETKARAYGKETRGLESADEHVRVFSDMYPSEAEVVLLQALIHTNDMPKRFHEQLVAWKSGDIERIYAIVAAEIKEAPTVWWRLLERRNEKWVPRIEAAIKSGKSTLIVAGAAHFAGPHSVIAMLRARGYKLEQL